MELGADSPLRSDYAARASNITIAFGERIIIDGADFELPASRRTVLLGANGTGKTTILNLIERADPRIRISPGAKIGYFSQRHETLDMNKSALENARAISSKPEHEVRTILARLEIKGDAVHKRCGVMSGGERAKVMFARLFASDLNTLILDEPTNHIDLYTSERLEELLASWRGAMLLVTHDRRMARKIAERLLIIRNKKILTYEGTLEEYQNRSAI
jgi:ATPase subunit of ABC transporter with duplicated ATPase domains